MSCYTAMLKPSKAHRQYLLQINEHGETVIYQLEADGKASSMACGTMKAVLGPAIEAATSGRMWIAGRPGDRYADHLPDSPHAWNFDYEVNTWRDLAEVLNGKSTPLRRECRAVYFTLHAVNAPIRDFIFYEDCVNKWAVGAKGIEYDRSAMDSGSEGPSGTA